MPGMPLFSSASFRNATDARRRSAVDRRKPPTLPFATMMVPARQKRCQTKSGSPACPSSCCQPLGSRKGVDLAASNLRLVSAGVLSVSTSVAAFRVRARNSVTESPCRRDAQARPINVIDGLEGRRSGTRRLAAPAYRSKLDRAGARGRVGDEADIGLAFRHRVDHRLRTGRSRDRDGENQPPAKLARDIAQCAADLPARAIATACPGCWL